MGLKIPNCFICLDKGYVIYTRGYYQFFSHCICPQGNKYHYDGQACTVNKSDYCIPPVDQVLDTVTLARENFRNWFTANREKPGMEKELNRRWQALAAERREQYCPKAE